LYGETTAVLSFPFGRPIRPVAQTDRGPKRVFVLGVYASAVHARWVSDTGRTVISALAVASEPEIFWRGDGAEEIVSQVEVPHGAGRLEPASRSLNGPSGLALDSAFLEPLGISRRSAWLCDLLPESRCNPKQAAALEREYLPLMSRFGLPPYEFPMVPAELANPQRVREIEREVLEASADVIVTLGDQPLKWFTSRYGSHTALSVYGESKDRYGRLHDG
jgi:hypothetical protein